MREGENMIRVENDFCGCAVPGYPCLGNSCPKRHVKHFYCDECGRETILYEIDGQQLCRECLTDCLIKDYDIVEGSEYYT